MTDYEEIEVTGDTLVDEETEASVITLEEVPLASEAAEKPLKKKAAKVHVVAEGENIQTIAAMYCGTKDRREYAKDLARRNKNITVGKTVVL